MPLINFVGWFLTVYVFLQLFAVAVRSGLVVREPARTFPRSHLAQAIVVYGEAPIYNGPYVG